MSKRKYKLSEIIMPVLPGDKRNAEYRDRAIFPIKARKGPRHQSKRK